MNIFRQIPLHPSAPRLRHDDFSRRLMREQVLTANDLIYPVFVLDGQDRKEVVASMPGVVRQSVDHLLHTAERAEAGRAGAGIVSGDRQFAQSLDAAEAHNPDGLVPRTIKALKQRFPGWASSPISRSTRIPAMARMA